MRYDLPKSLKTPYPGIAQACLSIALDNDGINRDRSERKWAGDFRRFIATRDALLPEIDTWLKGLTDEEFETVCVGEHTEMEELMTTAPAFTADLLNDYFDEVC